MSGELDEIRGHFSIYKGVSLPKCKVSFNGIKAPRETF